MTNFPLRRAPTRARNTHRCIPSFTLPMLLPAGLMLQTSAALAQAVPPTPAITTAPPTLERIVVTGNPLEQRELALPVSVLEGDALVLRRASTLGATVDGLPGVASTAFGPNAGRPVIRGLDGDRVRILNNAGASLDASSLSFDHAVPLDPLVIERVEVLRGPGALLHGGSAIGGVVNVIDNRIPRRPLSGTRGSLELRLGGADSERGMGALVETGNRQFALHADMGARNTSDLRVPRFAPVADGETLPETDRVANSASRSRSQAVGGSVFFDQGFLGMSLARDDKRYGIVVEPDVVIDMRREHLGLAGELRAPAGESLLGFTRLQGHLNQTRYQHEEIEGSGEVGTTFKTAGHELRLEATHRPWLAGLRGVLGLQLEGADFSALGEEAFVPTTRTTKRSLFALEELPWSGGHLTAGLRLERVQVSSEGDADPASGQFGPASQRRFLARSASLGQVTRLSPTWTLSGTYSRTERAPTSFELYANGVHAATAAYERGDPGLAKERGHNLDLALQWRQGDSHLRLGGYQARFSNFISLDVTGAEVQGLPEFAFRAVKARLSGLELEAAHRWRSQGWTIDLSGQLDLTRARQADTGEALPRVAPRRLQAGLGLGRGAWQTQLDVVQAAGQSRVPEADVPTAGYRLVNLSLSRRLNLGLGASAPQTLWFLRLGNLGNRLAYNATAVQTVRALSPQPGRSLQTGLRINF